jgi:hypothetical protein
LIEAEDGHYGFRDLAAVKRGVVKIGDGKLVLAKPRFGAARP